MCRALVRAHVTTKSKRLGETLCATYFRLHAAPVKTIRPFNVYGPGQRLDDQRIIPDLVSAALNGGPITLFSDGRPTRSFCYARDFAAALLLVLLSSENGEAFNIGNDEDLYSGGRRDCRGIGRQWSAPESGIHSKP